MPVRASGPVTVCAVAGSRQAFRFGSACYRGRMSEPPYRVLCYKTGCTCETRVINGKQYAYAANPDCPAHQDGPYIAVELDLDPDMSIDQYEPHPSVLTYGHGTVTTQTAPTRKSAASQPKG